MILGHFKFKNKSFYGIVENNSVYQIKGNIFKNFIKTKNKYTLSELKFLPPVKPSKIVAVGLNYKDHAEELNMPVPDEPVIFLKPTTSVIAHKENIVYPAGTNRVDYEAELAVIIKKKAYNLKNDVSNYIFGFTCANDVTARDLQKKDIQWTRAKSFDTFCPLGPWIYIPDKNENFDPHNLKIQTIINNQIKQNSSTSNLIFKIDFLLKFISNIMSLYPGDVILTGTPKGVGPVFKGDEIKIVIEKVGILINYVK